MISFSTISLKQKWFIVMHITCILGDCLEKMQTIPNESIDLILTDPPYGTTACKWDTIIPFEPMWKQLNRITKNNSPIVLFGSEPFSSYLRMSNIKMFKYDWIWNKSNVTNVLNAKRQPLRNIENISVFYIQQPTYNPQNLVEVNKFVGTGATKANEIGNATGKITKTKDNTYFQKNGNYPRQLLNFNSVGNNVHPTQKPVELLEYLIKTYTNENDTILDFTAGSFSTAIAAINTNRNFIGIEKDEKYFSTGIQRIENEIKLLQFSNDIHLEIIK